MMISDEIKECELCGETFTQRLKVNQNYPNDAPEVLNEYCDKCTKAKRIENKINRQVDQRAWRSLRKDLLEVGEERDFSHLKNQMKRGRQ